MKVPTSLGGFLAIALDSSVLAQQRGILIPEVHPLMRSQVCKKDPTTRVVQCVTEASSLVLEADQRPLTAVGTTASCYSNGQWNASVCSTSKACAEKCALEGVDYAKDHGVTATGDAVTLELSHVQGMSPRLYLLDASGTKYKQFQLLNQEFTFDVDVSGLPCGTNGALYFVKMDADGGTSRAPGNAAGAAYGMAYCDGQCHKGRFINGEANLNQTYATCCSEMDIWEANSRATSFATHACATDGMQVCSTPEACGSTEATQYTGLCDKAGCSFKPYRMGAKTFFGRGNDFAMDTTRPFTVITQFITRDNTSTGELVEIRRLYKQDNRVVTNPESTWPALTGIHSLTEPMCSSYKTFFGEHAYQVGRLAQLGKQMTGGMTLTFSVWADYTKRMVWLDSYEKGKDPTVPGVVRGPCDPDGGDPASVFANYPNAGVTFMNIRSGDFGSTY
ncbi:hypothetical protein PsorP6_013487 [Peronosclerospora sorghi]|uniref:Uncharacterized protein n=1 Tax=Peronosclerospora sorghi TaxID=230839 RepID=A0ACC0VGP7_9STRA|nr:hypothetical protein PsorP6_013487 [Peronosclerospora sorghi]